MKGGSRQLSQRTAHLRLPMYLYGCARAATVELQVIRHSTRRVLTVDFTPQARPEHFCKTTLRDFPE